MLFIVVGRTATGKDYLMDLMRKAGMEIVKSYTTRPKRTEDEDTHIFIDEKTALELLPSCVADTVIGQYRYLAMPEQLEQADVYNVDPPAIRRVCDMTPNLVKAIVHVKADRSISKKAAIRRGDADVEAAAFDKRTRSEDMRFLEFESSIEDGSVFERYGVQAVIEIENNYKPDVFDFAMDAILKLKEFADASSENNAENTDIIEKASELGFLISWKIA